MDWAAHLKHLQTVFQEFDANAVISEPVLICLFRNGLRPSIRAQAEQKDHWKDTWDQAIKKAITTKTKAALKLPLWVREMDACCPQSHCFVSKPIKGYIRDQGSLPFCPQEARTILPYCFEQAKTLERLRRDHQKDRHDKKRCHCSPRGSRPQGSIPSTEVNTTKIPA